MEVVLIASLSVLAIIIAKHEPYGGGGSRTCLACDPGFELRQHSSTHCRIPGTCQPLPVFTLYCCTYYVLIVRTRSECRNRTNDGEVIGGTYLIHTILGTPYTYVRVPSMIRPVRYNTHNMIRLELTTNLRRWRRTAAFEARTQPQRRQILRRIQLPTASILLISARHSAGTSKQHPQQQCTVRSLTSPWINRRPRRPWSYDTWCAWYALILITACCHNAATVHTMECGIREAGSILL